MYQREISALHTCDVIIIIFLIRLMNQQNVFNFFYSSKSIQICIIQLGMNCRYLYTCMYCIFFH